MIKIYIKITKNNKQLQTAINDYNCQNILNPFKKMMFYRKVKSGLLKVKKL